MKGYIFKLLRGRKIIMKYCGQCGAKLDDDAVFCTACGAKQEITSSKDGVNRNLNNSLVFKRILIGLSVVIVLLVAVNLCILLFRKPQINNESVVEEKSDEYISSNEEKSEAASDIEEINHSSTEQIIEDIVSEKEDSDITFAKSFKKEDTRSEVINLFINSIGEFSYTYNEVLFEGAYISVLTNENKGVYSIKQYKEYGNIIIDNHEEDNPQGNMYHFVESLEGEDFVIEQYANVLTGESGLRGIWKFNNDNKTFIKENTPEGKVVVNTVKMENVAKLYCEMWGGNRADSWFEIDVFKMEDGKKVSTLEVVDQYYELIDSSGNLTASLWTKYSDKDVRRHIVGGANRALF